MSNIPCFEIQDVFRSDSHLVVYVAGCLINPGNVSLCRLRIVLLHLKYGNTTR